eukprot:COSAG02_NODE_27923_length_600_cov_0.820359_2_plen_32_part_01
MKQSLERCGPLTWRLAAAYMLRMSLTTGEAAR